MNIKTILIILGEPNSTFSELLLKYFNSKIFKKNKKKIIIIGNKELFEKQSTILKYKIQLNEISNVDESSRRNVNIINVNYKFKKPFSRITTNSNKYIDECFKLSIKIPYFTFIH